MGSRLQSLSAPMACRARICLRPCAIVILAQVCGTAILATYVDNNSGFTSAEINYVEQAGKRPPKAVIRSARFSTAKCATPAMAQSMPQTGV